MRRPAIVRGVGVCGWEVREGGGTRALQNGQNKYTGHTDKYTGQSMRRKKCVQEMSFARATTKEKTRERMDLLPVLIYIVVYYNTGVNVLQYYIYSSIYNSSIPVLYIYIYSSIL